MTPDDGLALMSFSFIGMMVWLITLVYHKTRKFSAKKGRHVKVRKNLIFLIVVLIIFFIIFDVYLVGFR